MGDKIRFGWSAAFYLLALAATMSGLVSKTGALVLALIGTAFLFWATFHYLRAWHSAKKISGRRGLDSWYFIVACAVMAILGIAGAAYGIGLRSSAVPVRDEAAKPQQSSPTGSASVEGVGVALPPAKYNKAQIGKILEAISTFHSILIRMDRTLVFADGITGSLEGIIAQDGYMAFLKRMDDFRLMYLSPGGDFDKAYEDFSLYSEATRIVADKKSTMIHFSLRITSWLTFLHMIASALANIVKPKKDTFKTRVHDYLEWIGAKKKALEEYREWYLRQPTTD
jgi:hypothetical protein